MARTRLHPLRQNVARVRSAVFLTCVLAFALPAPAPAAPLAPGSGLASAGGDCTGGGMRLTFALGEPGAGPLSGGSTRAIAQWLRRPALAVLDAGPGAPHAGGLCFSAYPNPFADRIVVRFSSAPAGSAASRVRLELYDISGRLVRRLVDADLPAGSHEVAWDGRESAGALAPAGLYLCRLQDGPNTLVRRLTLVR